MAAKKIDFLCSNEICFWYNRYGSNERALHVNSFEWKFSADTHTHTVIYRHVSHFRLSIRANTRSSGCVTVNYLSAKLLYILSGLSAIQFMNRHALNQCLKIFCSFHFSFLFFDNNCFVPTHVIKINGLPTYSCMTFVCVPETLFHFNSE